MLLPEHGPDIALCDPSQWETHKSRLSSWRGLTRRLQMLARRRSAPANPETRLAQMISNLGGSSGAEWSDDPGIVQRLEAHLATTDDVELRKVFASFLCEP